MSQTDELREAVAKHLEQYPNRWIQSMSLSDCFGIDQSQTDAMGALTDAYPQIHRKWDEALVVHTEDPQHRKSTKRLHYCYDERPCDPGFCECEKENAKKRDKK